MKEDKGNILTPLQIAITNTLAECGASPETIRAFLRSKLAQGLAENNIDQNVFPEYLGDIHIDKIFNNLSNINRYVNSMNDIRAAVKSKFSVDAEFVNDPNDPLNPRKRFVRLVLEPTEE